MVKIFTMVKGEVDIVKDWVLYHGSLFGYNNLYIIDNYSQDGTYETLLDLKNKYNIKNYSKNSFNWKKSMNSKKYNCKVKLPQLKN